MAIGDSGPNRKRQLCEAGIYKFTCPIVKLIIQLDDDACFCGSYVFQTGPPSLFLCSSSIELARGSHLWNVWREHEAGLLAPEGPPGWMDWEAADGQVLACSSWSHSPCPWPGCWWAPACTCPSQFWILVFCLCGSPGDNSEPSLTTGGRGLGPQGTLLPASVCSPQTTGHACFTDFPAG